MLGVVKWHVWLAWRSTKPRNNLLHGRGRSARLALPSACTASSQAFSVKAFSMTYPRRTSKTRWAPLGTLNPKRAIKRPSDYAISSSLVAPYHSTPARMRNYFSLILYSSVLPQPLRLDSTKVKNGINLLLSSCVTLKTSTASLSLYTYPGSCHVK